MPGILAVTRDKLERGHDSPKSVIAKCCCALLLSDKEDINYITTSTFLLVLRPFFKIGEDKWIFDSYNHVLHVT